jgi:transposase
MAYNFIPADRNQPYMLPPSLDDWLPEDHPARFIVDIVKKLDLAPFYVGRRDDGWGRAAYDPKVIVGVLLYAYSRGVRSSRAIERGLIEDVGLRYIAVNNCPDHATIARFRKDYGDALAELFPAVLHLCVRANIVDASLIAVDGTKIQADASPANNLTEEDFRKLVRDILDDAERIDQEEDRAHGDRRGDELPDHLVDEKHRLEWIERELEEIKKSKEPWRKSAPRVNSTDPDSRVLKVRGGYLQGYNAQAVVDRNQVILAADVFKLAADAPLFEPMITTACDNLQAAGGAPPGTALADAGYISLDNATLDAGCNLLIAPSNPKNIAKIKLDLDERQSAYEARIDEIERIADRRVEVMEDLVAKRIVLREAADRLGMSVPGVWAMKKRYQSVGRKGVQPKAPPPPELSAKEIMAAKLLTEEAKKTYALRSVMVEPVFGQIKWDRAMRRFHRRGIAACRVEWMLEATVHNLLKLWRSGWSGGAASSELVTPCVAA